MKTIESVLLANKLKEIGASFGVDGDVQLCGFLLASALAAAREGGMSDEEFVSAAAAIPAMVGLLDKVQGKLS